MSRRPRVLTPKGWLEGTEERGVQVFRGIPFAASTAGEGRFRAPEAIEPWPGTRDASRFGQAALQGPGSSGPLARWSPVPRAGAGEDCLNLNVWTPAVDKGRRPVLVWIHGGGFSHGSGSFHLYAGDRLAKRGDTVVVTFNYRLGVFGGLDLRSLGAGSRVQTNLGLRDQIAALGWVRANIEAFGGDPENVTVFGQSAGAMSAATLMACPDAKGLFHRGILQSGAGDNVLDKGQARRVAEVLVGQLGLDPARSDLTQALRALDSGTLLDAHLKMRARHGLPLGTLAWQPVLDNDLVPDLPRSRFELGQAMEVPLLIGTNLDEWKMFTATDKRRRTLDRKTLKKYLVQTFGGRDEHSDDGVRLARIRADEALSLYEFSPDGGRRSPAEMWASIQTDRVFHYPAVRLAAAHTSRGAPTWFYRFDWKPPLAPNRVGACHALELAFVFGTLKTPWLRPLFGMSSEAVALSDRMQAAWLSFARTGEPNSEGDADWSRYESGNGKATLLGGSHPAQDVPDPGREQFWNEVDAGQGTAAPRDPESGQLNAHLPGRV